MSIKAQLFITCLSEQFFPDVLKSMVSVLERLGVQVDFPEAQTCCGQPFLNSGFQTDARRLARHWLETFTHAEGYIISPSGSCVDMISHRYLELFPAGTPERQAAVDAAGRTFEFTQFLVNELHVTDVGARFPHKVAYHASCHLLRGLGAHSEPQALLSDVRDLELVTLENAETCCGFGGTFSVIYPEVSQAILQAKIRDILASGADVVVACDAGCLMNIAGGLTRAGSSVRAMHIAQILGNES